MTVAMSQRQHGWLEFHKSKGCEFVFPFFYPKNWLELSSAQNATDMGKLQILSCMPPRVATASASNVAYISIYAWMENVELEGQTSKLAMQSSEYEVGPISRPASIVAGIGRRLSDVPVIGPFAKATGFVAGAAAKVASLFGFSDVPVIKSSVPMKNQPFHGLASSQIGAPIERLTLDPKAELSIDPRIAGLDGEDPLSIAKLVQHESFVAAGDWNISDTVDTVLVSSNVTPVQGRLSFVTVSATSIANLVETPMEMVAQHFNSWRGDIKYRIKVVASQYHQGRLLIAWDPMGSDVNSANSTTVQNKVIDITQEDEFEFIVPYVQSTAFKNCGKSFTDNTNTRSTAPTYDGTSQNGRLSITVLNPLTAPLTTANARIFVFMSGTETLEFANPNDIQFFYPSVLAPQSQETELGQTTSVPDERYLVNFGEDIRSLRTLLRRSTLYRRIPIDLGTTNAGALVSYGLNMNVYPMQYGYQANGPDLSKKVDGTGSVACAMVAPTPHNYISACFVGQRGGMNYSLNFEGNVQPTFRATRKPFSQSAYSQIDVQTITNIPSSVYRDNSKVYGVGGMSLTNMNTQTGLQVNVPYMSNLKFASTNPLWKQLGSTSDDTDRQNWSVIVANTSASGAAHDYGVVSIYYSIGIDYTPLYFCNCPVRYSYTLAP